jgi:hypothetical protein
MTTTAHDHVHLDESIQVGAQQWLAREFVGGLIAIAQTHEVNVADFLAEKCVILAMRAATGEAERDVLRAQVQDLQQQVDDCPCHDENIDVAAESGMPAPPVGVLPSNGDASA